MLPKVVCITGGIGSGKSAVCHLIIEAGYPVYNSDDRAKWLMENQPELIQGIKNIFSKEAYIEGALNRAYLSKRIFEDPELKMALEKLVHPAVGNDFNNWRAAQKSEIVFKESALAIEIKDPTCQCLVSVTADKLIRQARVLLRNPSWSLSDVVARMKTQVSDEIRIAASDFTIANEDELEVLKEKVDYLLAKLRVI